jgi:hypothetical protein
MLALVIHALGMLNE